jgi:hypothetical protein
LLHHLVQPIKICEIRYVTLNTGDIFADPSYSCINSALASTKDESIGTLLDELLRRSKAYTAATLILFDHLLDKERIHISPNLGDHAINKSYHPAVRIRKCFSILGSGRLVHLYYSSVA